MRIDTIPQKNDWACPNLFFAKKAFKTLTELINEEGEIDFEKPCGLIWSGNDKLAMDKYKTEQSVIFQGSHNREIPEYIIGSTIGVYVGPGAVGFAFFKK